MRTKDEILTRCRDDIQNPKYNEQAPLWLEYRKIEVLIDIRDCIQHLFDLRHAWDEEPKPPN